MIFEQLCDVEQAGARAVRSVRVVGERELLNRLNSVEYILAEVRHAGQVLCDRSVSSELRNAAVNRLIGSLFTSV